MSKLISEEIVEAITLGDREGFMSAFHSALAAKVSDALEIKKVEIASTLIAPASSEVVEEEVEQIDELDQATLNNYLKKVGEYDDNAPLKRKIGVSRASERSDAYRLGRNPNAKPAFDLNQGINDTSKTYADYDGSDHTMRNKSLQIYKAKGAAAKRNLVLPPKSSPRTPPPKGLVLPPKRRNTTEEIDEAKGESRVSWRSRTPEEIAKSDKRRKVKVTSAELEARARARRAEKSE